MLIFSKLLSLAHGVSALRSQPPPSDCLRRAVVPCCFVIFIAHFSPTSARFFLCEICSTRSLTIRKDGDEIVNSLFSNSLLGCFHILNSIVISEIRNSEFQIDSDSTKMNVV